MKSKNSKFFSKHSAGFTLIELLVVISIIGMLASVVVASLNNTRIKARDTKRKADLRQMATALQLYYDANNAFPNDDTSFGAGNDWTAAYKTQMSPYTTKPPRDPLQDSAGNWRFYGSYRMTWSPGGVCDGFYVLWTYLESASDSEYGKSTCGFGGVHYFLKVDRF